jgi:Outer membrane protein beta-barrel domain
MRRSVRLVPLAALATMLEAAPARADVTAFIGASTSPSTRMSAGASLGGGFVIVGLEFEFMQVGGEDPEPGRACLTFEACAPSLRTVMGNVLLQTPGGLPVQVYGTVGAGYFRERFETLDVQETGLGTNVGGGVKIRVAGPLRLRLDYRIFKLSGDAVYSTPQRFYAGANLAF